MPGSTLMTVLRWYGCLEKVWFWGQTCSGRGDPLWRCFFEKLFVGWLRKKYQQNPVIHYFNGVLFEGNASLLEDLKNRQSRGWLNVEIIEYSRKIKVCGE